MSLQLPHEAQAPWGRTGTINKTLAHLTGMAPPYTIVEIGGIRNPLPAGRMGDGHATTAWGWVTSKNGGEVYSVDIDPDVAKITKMMCSSHPQVHTVTADGIEFLKGFDKPTHLLYLDGWDVGTPLYKQRHFEAFLVSLKNFKLGSLVLIDDTNLDNLGKGEFVIGYAQEHGWEVLFTEMHQTLLELRCI